MKIACLAGNDLRTAERVRAHARALAASGHEVTMFGVQAPDAEPEEDDGEVLVVRVPLAPWAWRDRGPAAIWRVARWYERFGPLAATALRRGPPDVFHAFGLDVLEPAVAAARSCGARVVFDDPGVCRAGELVRRLRLAPRAPHHRARCAVLDMLVRRGETLQRTVRSAGLDMLVVPTPELGADIVGRYGGPHPEVVRDTFVGAIRGDRRRLRARLGASPHERLIVYRGRSDARSGLSAALGALRILGPGHVLVLLGWDRAREEVERLAVAERVSDRLRFLPPVPRDEALEWMSGADVLLLPDEPVDGAAGLVTPVALYEGLAAGVPIVAADLPATGALIRQTGAGLLYPARRPSDPGAVAEALRTVLADPFLAAACGEQAHAALASELSPRHQDAALRRVYDALAAVI